MEHDCSYHFRYQYGWPKRITVMNGQEVLRLRMANEYVLLFVLAPGTGHHHCRAGWLMSAISTTDDQGALLSWVATQDYHFHGWQRSIMISLISHRIIIILHGQGASILSFITMAEE